MGFINRLYVLCDIIVNVFMGVESTFIHNTCIHRSSQFVFITVLCKICKCKFIK